MDQADQYVPTALGEGLCPVDRLMQMQGGCLARVFSGYSTSTSPWISAVSAYFAHRLSARLCSALAGNTCPLAKEYTAASTWVLNPLECRAMSIRRSSLLIAEPLLR